MACNSVTSPDVHIKQPGEKRQFSMDFSSLMATAEAITSVSVTSTPTGLTITDEEIGSDDQSATMWIEDGTHLKTYTIEVTVVTDAGQTLVGDGKLKVLDS